jgi:hypothetical protein
MPSISDRYATHTRDWLPSFGMIARMLRMDGRPGGHVESTKVQNGATVINHAADAIIKKWKTNLADWMTLHEAALTSAVSSIAKRPRGLCIREQRCGFPSPTAGKPSRFPGHGPRALGSQGGGGGWVGAPPAGMAGCGRRGDNAAEERAVESKNARISERSIARRASTYGGLAMWALWAALLVALPGGVSGGCFTGGSSRQRTPHMACEIIESCVHSSRPLIPDGDWFVKDQGLILKTSGNVSSVWLLGSQIL